MIYDDEDEVMSTDMYLKQDNFSDVAESEELEVHISKYDTPQIDYYTESTFTMNDSDNSSVVFNIKQIQTSSRVVARYKVDKCGLGPGTTLGYRELAMKQRREVCKPPQNKNCC